MDGVYQMAISTLIIVSIATSLLLVKKIFFRILHKIVSYVTLQIEEFFEIDLQVPLTLLITIIAV